MDSAQDLQVMANNDSQTLQMDDVPIEDNILPDVQGELPLEMLETDIVEDCSPATPEQKIGTKVGKDEISEIFLGSESGSSDFSTKESSSESLSPSSLSSDAESGTYNLVVKNYLLQHDNVDEKENVHFDKQVMKGMQYEGLLEQVASYEVELKFAKKKLQSKQEEIDQLKYENLTLVEELGRTIENLHTSENHMAKMEEKFRMEFQDTQHQLQVQLDLANQNIGLLQEILTKTTKEANDYKLQTDDLKLALHNAQQDFSRDRLQFESERDTLDARLKEADQKSQFLEDQIQQYEMAMAEVKTSCDAREMGLLDEITQLKADLSQSLDEKDRVFSELQAEMKNRDILIGRMEECLSKSNVDKESLVEESRKSQKLAEELKIKVTDQENELEKQRAMISERDEEKREAIRQLCFSLDHYRNGYHELCQAFIKHKHPTELVV